MIDRAQLRLQMQNTIKSHPYTERDAFHLIGCFTAVEPVIAAALCFHIRDIIQETFESNEDAARAQLAEMDEAEPEDSFEIDIELDYASILADAYDRCFFDEVGAAKYGTQVFCGDDAKISRLVSTLHTMRMVEEAGDPTNVIVMRGH